MGYHINKINKGILGEFSKVQEEWEELMDARQQGGKVLELCELSDLYGAIDAYLRSEYTMTIDDIKTMSDMTVSAFREGSRK